MEARIEEIKEEGTNRVEDKIQPLVQIRTEAKMEDSTAVKMVDKTKTKMEDRREMEGKTETKMEDRTGMTEERKAEARVAPARQEDNLQTSVLGRSCSAVLMSVQDFLPGSLELV